MKPAADFLIHGGDLAQLGDPVELDLGNQILQDVKIKKVYILGSTTGTSTWARSGRGCSASRTGRSIGAGSASAWLDTVSRGPDYWTAKKMSPKERMGHMATLDGSVAGAWAGVGRDQLRCSNKTLSSWKKDAPVIVFSHNPLYEYYPPWNFWVRDWREVHEVLRPFANVTNIHGHTHQVL